PPTLVILMATVVRGQHCPAPENHVCQVSVECYYTFNGTQRLMIRYVYNREEFLYFDSEAWGFHAVTELGRLITERLNKLNLEELGLTRAKVDSACRESYQELESLTVQRRVRPKVNVSPSKKGSSQHQHLLVCHVTDFYPGDLQVRWFLNGQEETDGVVSTNLIRNGDWTFQILVMLEMNPHAGDVYTCHVEHPSLDSPITVDWKAQSDLARSKMLTGVGGLVLGLVFLAVGVFMHRKSKKVQRGSR
ncbi:HLA class II histocompatibility antigen, DP beta 1 chain-like, partial [Ochotona curzoniae]|uniref:HLA class II histocompatibility antigen, DP beta 1 chain-like n=1 Tax=Ochotona curzoniae TaxID=130825 RepID=UPI001B351B71